MTLDELIARAKKASENQCMCDRCRENAKQLAEWLEELKQYKLASPHKKPAYKLTKFEKDLLQSCSQGYSPKYQFKNINSLTEMREKGYFKGIDRDATIEDILANCDISEED